MLNMKSTILIVDDILLNRIMLEKLILELGHRVLMAENGQVALELIMKDKPDLILLDIIMPVMNGFEMLMSLQSDKNLSSIPVLIISAVDDMDDIVKGIELGAADFLVKPFNLAMLKVRINTCLEKKYENDIERYSLEHIKAVNMSLLERVNKQVQDITQSQVGMIFAMCKIAESYDSETAMHLKRIREYCKALAVSLQAIGKYSDIIDDSFIETLYQASPLHDIGQISIDDYILNKPSKLSTKEFECMKEHTQKGAEALLEVYSRFSSNQLLYMGAQIAQYHHEKWDGSGYPNGLKGDNIPLSARILALGDVYDALRSKRPYKEAFSHEESVNIILAGAGTHFDPNIVQSFLNIEDTFLQIREKFHDQ